MSQHTYSNQNYKIQYGYEWTFDGFYLLITNQKNHFIEYSNLDRNNPAMRIEEIKEVLRSYSIQIPNDLDVTLKTDREKEY